MRNYIAISQLLLLMVSVASCAEQRKPAVPITIFHNPVVLQTSTIDTVEFVKAEHLTDAYPRFIGKSKFCDTLEIPFQGKLDDMPDEDFVDDGAVWRVDSFTSDGFELFTDYQSTVAYTRHFQDNGQYYYPIYVVNNTPRTKYFIGKDSYVFAIQEAVDTNGYWHPIEGRGLDFCGNGYWGLKIHPKEFLIFMMPKYEGDFQTKIRVRIKIGDMVYISESFQGTINEKQFYFNKNYDYHYEKLVESQTSAIQHLFYGAVPKEVLDKNFGLHAVYAK